MVRTRFAPSPTGYLHIGGVRTALFNWLYARQHGGQFVLRIDDTDQQRNLDAALRPILEGFRWLGLEWDEGPEVGGPHAPYFQSQRLDRYQLAVQELLNRRAAYYDYARPEELQAEREAAEREKRPYVYSRTWLAETDQQRATFEAQGRRAVVRLKMPREGKLTIDDLIRGPVRFEWSREQDHVIQRTDGSCLYHLATVIDDHDLDITHVIRAEEHLSNTPRQIFIAQSLDYERPRFAHLPYVAEPGSRTKLSKRKLHKYLKQQDFARLYAHGQSIAKRLGVSTELETFNPVLVDFYRQVGFLPDALVNYLLLLGWSLDDRTEIFSRPQMIQQFSLERVNSAPASFDPQKLMAFQSHYMQQLPVKQKVAGVLPYLQSADLVSSPPPDSTENYVGQVVEAAGDRITIAGDVLDFSDFFLPTEQLCYDEAAFDKRLRGAPASVQLLRRFRPLLTEVEPYDAPTLEQLLQRFVQQEGIKISQIIHTLRVALTGKAVGFGMFETLEILGRQRSLDRMDRALHLLASPKGSLMGKETSNLSESSESSARLNFIEQIVVADQASGKYEQRVHTRFPPEPNGYLHIGHAKSICLNFGLAEKYAGQCNLRFDDTNPTKESHEYVASIKEDVRWLGFDWDDRLYFASSYFDQLHQWAIQLIKAGKAYVCDLTTDQIRQYRGTLTEPGRDSPDRDRSVEENLELFERMRKGEFADGSRTLRAKINMASPNLNMRDPVMYRILHASHHRTGDKWCIYPMYDFTHGQSDSIERITHSICTLEFEDHRPLYNWYLDQLEIYHPQQIEFARLNLTYTVMSKRKLLQLVNEGHVNGWDDPRMPTICGLRRRGYTPESIRSFCDTIGVAKFNSTIDMQVLDNSVREHLNRTAPRVMAVLRPLKLVITNYPEDQVEELTAVNNPEDEATGTRLLPFSRELYIEQDDFREDPPKKYFRLSPGAEVRLRYAYIIRCVDVVKDPKTGEVTEVHCTYDPQTRSGLPEANRKVKGTLHWVSASHAIPAEVRMYDNLFCKPDPDATAPGQTFLANLNPKSLELLTHCRLEPSLATATLGSRYQFERLGYFCIDPDSRPEALVFNRTVPLRDTWAKIEKKSRG